VAILVKPHLVSEVNPLIYYPLDGNVWDYSGNGYDAILSGAVQTPDALGNAARAYLFSSSPDLIYTVNKPALNFQDKITISFWLKIDQVPEEIYVISHGSWEERYKISVTPEKRLRWTVKTDVETKDIDNSTVLLLNEFNHYTVCYTGYSMEIYINGELDVFTPMTGKIQQTAKDLTIGHKDRSTNSYFLRGIIDEIKIFSDELPVSEINALQSMWNSYSGINSPNSGSILVYPNPADQFVYLKSMGKESPLQIEVSDITGQRIGIHIKEVDANTFLINLTNPVQGVVLFKIIFRDNQIMEKVIFR
jgi:hypothetical protein